MTSTLRALFLGLAALCGVVWPVAFLFITYRQNSAWYPATFIPWSQLIVGVTVSLALNALVTQLLVQRGRSLPDSIVLATAVVWPLWVFGQTETLATAVGGGKWTMAASFAALYTIVVYVAVRIVGRDGPYALGMVVVIVTALTLMPAGPVFRDLVPSITAEASFEPADERRVWVIVLDEFAAPEYLQSIDEHIGSLAESQLAAAGFTVAHDARSPYPSTYPSLGGAFSLEPMLPGPHDLEAVATQAAVFSGDHPLVAAYQSAGRSVIMVEPPIAPARCGELITVCYRSPVDDFVNFVLRNSIVALVRPQGDAHWPLSAADQFKTLTEIARQPPGGELILGHLMLPHAPFRVDAGCELAGELQPLEVAYLRNVECLNQQLTQFVREIPPEDVVLIMGDHGLRLEDDRTTKTQRAIDTVDSAFIALRGCRVSDEYLETNVNAYRGLVNCVTTAQLPPVELPTMVACYFEGGRMILKEAIVDEDTGVVDCAAPWDA